MKTIEEIEQLFVAACDKAIAKGWKIEAGGFVDFCFHTCCPITALVGCKPGVSWMDQAMQITGASRKQLEAFYNAFDENGFPSHDVDFHTLGQKLRAKYITQ